MAVPGGVRAPFMPYEHNARLAAVGHGPTERPVVVTFGALVFSQHSRVWWFCPAACSGSVDTTWMDATSTSLERHERGIHALWAGAGGVRVTEVRSRVR